MRIKNQKEYKRAVYKVYQLMDKGDAMTNTEAKEAEAFAKAIEDYEDTVLKIMPLKVTVNSIVQDKISEMNLTQNQLARMLGISKAKLSLILNSKRKPDIKYLKAIHKTLGVDGNFILENV